MDPIDMMVTDANCEYLGLSRLCLMEAAGKSLGDEVAKIAVFTFPLAAYIAAEKPAGPEPKIITSKNNSCFIFPHPN